MKIEPESWRILSPLLDAWLELPEELRAGWIENLGPEHAGLLPMLRQMIASQATIDDKGFLNTLPRMDGSANSDARLLSDLAAGALVGPYRLIGELGQGGMGVVWLAQRADGEVKRPVALKLPIISLHNRTLADRFTRERDILAQLTHPRIARLYDAGVTDRGQPYLALEYVEGEKITSYCDTRRLGVKARLQLFLQVLGAAQYAHTNLIVHRDLKPANILVTKEADVRLLDFGIAKMLTDGEANETEITRMGGSALTPDYASPEQIAGSTVTTASDVYSLGVILYELLTGGRPYKLKRDTRSGLEDAILASEPARPSQTAAGDSAAQARGVTAKRLARSLKGDLDTIVLKALSKQPAQRYATADAFAQDIERYLGGEAVLAQPESTWYRARKFVFRNKLAVGSAVAVVAALSIGLGIALREAHIAQVQTRTAETVRTFLLDIFRANSNEHDDPVKARQTTARELLDLGAKKIDGALNDAPEAKLDMLETLSQLYLDLGLDDQAVALGRKRIALAKSAYGPRDPEVARALVDLANGTSESSSVNDSAALLKEAGTILDRNREFQSRIRAGYLLSMGSATFQTDLAGSEAFAAKSVNLYRKYPPSAELVAALNFLGQVQRQRQKYPEAIASLSEAASMADSVKGAAKGTLPAIYSMLGDSQRYLLDLSGAEKSLRRAVELARAWEGEEHRDVLQTQYRLGVFLAQTSRPEEGLALLKATEELAVRTKGPDELFHTPMVRRGYGVSLIEYGRVEDGLVLLAKSIDVPRRLQRSQTRAFANRLEVAVVGEIELGHYQRASAMLEEASAIRTRLGDKPSSGQLNDAALARAGLLVATGKADEAAQALQEFSVGPVVSSKISYAWLDVTLARAEVDVARNRPDMAIEQAREVRRRIEGSGLGTYFKRREAQAALLEGKGLLLTQHAPEALPLLQRGVQLGSNVYDPDRSPILADSQIALARCLLALGRGDEARGFLARAKAIHATHKDLGEQFRKPLHEMEVLLASRD